MQRLTPLRATLALTAAFALAGPGCDRKDPIRAYNAPKEPPEGIAAVTPKESAGESTGESTPPAPIGSTVEIPPARAAKPIAWVLPAGWEERPGGGTMRYATFRIAGPPPMEGTVLVLSAPQGVLPNVNRWEGELKLPPTAEADLPKVVKEVATAGGPAQTVDLVSPADAAKPERTLGAILPHGPSVWFFKLRGPADAVEAQKAKFDALVKSVHFPEAPETPSESAGPASPPPSTPSPSTPSPSTPTPATPTPLLPTAAEGTAGKLESWKLPPGWVQDDPKPMRVVSFHAGESNAAGNAPGNAGGNGGNETVNVIVTRFGVGHFGSLLGNLNRWRGEAGLPPVADEGAVKPQPLTVAGTPGQLFDFAGTPAEGTPGRRVVVATVQRGEDVWFFKLIGPAKTVDAQKANFDAFLSSLKFAGE